MQVNSTSFATASGSLHRKLPNTVTCCKQILHGRFIFKHASTTHALENALEHPPSIQNGVVQMFLWIRPEERHSCVPESIAMIFIFCCFPTGWKNKYCIENWIFGGQGKGFFPIKKDKLSLFRYWSGSHTSRSKYEIFKKWKPWNMWCSFSNYASFTVIER